MPLEGLDILVVEDHYFVAIELASVLRSLGANVVGPMAQLPLDGELAGERIDVALLDVGLQYGTSFSLIDEMADRGVPVALITGYGPRSLPLHYRALPRLEKPVECDKLRATVMRLAGRPQGVAA